jgi:alpha-galactosidase
MSRIDAERRRLLQLAALAGVATAPAAWSMPVAADGQDANSQPAAASLADGRMLVEFDRQLRMRLSHPGAATNDARAALTEWMPAGCVLLQHGVGIERFEFQQQTQQQVDGPLGAGARQHLSGVSADGLQMSVDLELFQRFPGFALMRVSYRNTSSQPMKLNGWRQLQLRLPAGNHDVRDPHEPPFWSYCGSTHADRRDWVQPVRPGFTQDNFMGMSASDYGGGTPIIDVWRRDIGVAIGHLHATPQLIGLPLMCDERGASLAATATIKQTLAPGETLEPPEMFVAVHGGDYFAVLDAYRQIMATRGMQSSPPPESAYEPIWCAWGYERSCTPELIAKTLPKVRELGLRWAVIDDGWQNNVGDWRLNAEKYPGGDQQMQQLVAQIRSQDLKPRLWWTPLAAAPGSDLLHDHTDMLLLGKDGAVRNVSWWNSFYLCPAYEPTRAYTLDLVRKFLKTWGFAGLKIDGQHLNAVAPCFNPAHRHARPEESVEQLQDFFQAIHRTAMEIDPQAVVELCPCGTSYSFFNLQSLNQAPASDPESSWQVRHKGKTLKALIGPGAAFAGDHVELSEGGRDFASTVGIGGIVSTKFTWPVDPKPKDSFLLTPDKEVLWRKWIALYEAMQLPRGTYRGELYDIGFDKPETHVTERAGSFYYAFYAREFRGNVSLRGLKQGQYHVRDCFADRDLGPVHIDGSAGVLPVAFEHFLLLQATPA